MEIHGVDFFRYDLPFRHPLQVGGRTTTRRRGFIIRVWNEMGASAWGECAPWPGISRESETDVLTQLRDLRSVARKSPLPGGSEALRDLAAGWASSTRCGVEMAMADLFRRSGPHQRRTGPLRVNALLTGPPDQWAGEASMRVGEGFTVLKFKVGRHAPEEEVLALRSVRERVGANVTFRLDANRAWSLDQAVAFSRAARDLGIEYVEEPLSDPDQLKILGAQYDLPIALDETLAETGRHGLRDLPCVTAWVLKPTLLGGLEAARCCAEAARASGRTAVFSSLFESGIGLLGIAKTALETCPPETAHGLATVGCFRHDLLRQPIDMAGGQINIDSDRPDADDVRLDLLEAVT